MIRNISVGIDVGSAMTRVVVGEFTKGEQVPKIIGIGEATTEGVRHGYISNLEEAVYSIRKAVDAAEKTSGIKIRRAFISISGTSQKSEIANGAAIITKADGEVTQLDVNKALEDCEENLNLNNRKVIQVVPLSYKLDSKEVEGRLEGMKGSKLEVRALFVTYSVQHLEDLLSALAEAGIETIDVIPSGIASSMLCVSDRQKVAGGALVDIGAEKVSIWVFENGLLSGVHTFSIGGADITNDIALGMKIPLETAESMKLGNLIEDYSKKKLDEIIEARLTDFFELLTTYLKKIKRSELLPAGIVFVGGGSATPDLAELAKDELNLPCRIGTTEMFGNTKTKLRDPAWFTALGLTIAAKSDETYSEGGMGKLFKDLKKGFKSTLKQLMP